MLDTAGRYSCIVSSEWDLSKAGSQSLGDVDHDEKGKDAPTTAPQPPPRPGQAARGGAVNGGDLLVGGGDERAAAKEGGGGGDRRKSRELGSAASHDTTRYILARSCEDLDERAWCVDSFWVTGRARVLFPGFPRTAEVAENCTVEVGSDACRNASGSLEVCDGWIFRGIYGLIVVR